MRVMRANESKVSDSNLFYSTYRLQYMKQTEVQTHTTGREER